MEHWGDLKGDIKGISFFIDTQFSIQAGDTMTDRYILQSTKEAL
jgi:hypothetical protein